MLILVFLILNIIQSRDVYSRKEEETKELDPSPGFTYPGVWLLLSPSFPLDF